MEVDGLPCMRLFTFGGVGASLQITILPWKWIPFHCSMGVASVGMGNACDQASDSPLPTFTTLPKTSLQDK